eukprot:c5660_g1_i1 orf=272-454(+)
MQNTETLQKSCDPQKKKEISDNPVLQKETLNAENPKEENLNHPCYAHTYDLQNNTCDPQK